MRRFVCIIFILFILVVDYMDTCTYRFQTIPYTIDGVYKCGPLYITVASTEDILLNWDFKSCDPKKRPDTIIFYTLDENNKIKKEKFSTKGVVTSYQKTKHKFPTPYVNYPKGWNKNDKNQKYGTHCLPYVIESSRRGQVIDRRCMRIYPAWMQNFGDLRLGEMMIPGTHNSGAWTGVAPILMDKYVLNQDRNLYEQLVFGQRYFDIRIGIHKKEFRITHNFVQTSRLDDELENIAKFVRKSPKEIVILDIHKFNIPAKFTKIEHSQVMKLLGKKIGKFVFPKNAIGDHKDGPTLKKLWSYRKNIIVAYQEKELVNKHKFFWPAINRDWGDKIELEKLKDYIISVAKKHLSGNPMRVLMAELTPTMKYILRHPTKGLGRLADEVNRNLTLWIRYNKLAPNLNLIASDYFLGNRLTEYAIGVNGMKLYRKRKGNL